MKKILIFHTAFIGDIVLSTALVKNIKKLYPQSEITYVTTPAGKAVLSNNPHLKEVIAYDKRGKNKGIKGMLSLAKELRKKRFDIAYIPHRYLRSSLVCFLAKIPSRIGYDISEGKLFLNKKVTYRKDLHEVDRLLELLGTDCDDKKLELFPSDEDKRYIDNFLLDKDIKGKKLIALAIGSKWNTKRWPIEYFNELIEKLEKIEDIKLILVGGNEEKELSVKYTDKTINAIGETSLLQLAELIRRPELSYDVLAPIDKHRPQLPWDVCEQVNINLKYEGYIDRQLRQVEHFKKLENKLIPDSLDYLGISGLRKEAMQKLDKFRPRSIGQASRISGVSPADISVLLVYLESLRRKH